MKLIISVYCGWFQGRSIMAEGSGGAKMLNSRRWGSKYGNNATGEEPRGHM